MGKVITIASGKGGVGKTIITAALGLQLGALGHRTLLIDGDMGLRNLDLVLGLENEVLYDAIDLASGKCLESSAILSVADKVDFIAASQRYTWEKLDGHAVLTLFEDMVEDYDYVVVDSPAGRGKGYLFTIKEAAHMLFVVEPTWVSLRDTDRLMQHCNKKRNWNYSLLLNNFYNGVEPYLAVDQILETLQPENVAGVLPHDLAVMAAAQNGMMASLDSHTPFMTAIADVARSLVDGSEPNLQAMEKLLPKEDSIIVSVKNNEEVKPSVNSMQQRLRQHSHWRWKRR